MAHDNIGTALLAAQRRIGAAKAGSENPFYKSKYANLGDVMEAVKEILNAEGIVVSQTLEVDEVGGVPRDILCTELLHATSMSRVRSRSYIPISPDIQKWGGALSYMKRYQLQAITFVPTEDDDGQTAKGSPSLKSKYTGSMKNRAQLANLCKEADIRDNEIVRQIHKALIKDGINDDDKSIALYIEGFTV